jgi:hypothetical protein
MTISSPLTTIPAKLLFVAMKEMVPTRAPPHLPLAPGPGIVGETQQDYREVNQSPGARLCRVVTWNWVTGSPNRVDGDPCEIDDRWEESKVWDTEWWRRLLCIRCRAKRPKHLPGDVYKLGSMRGCWHGKKYVRHLFSFSSRLLTTTPQDPAGNLFRHFLDHPDAPYPGIRDPQHPNFFTEMSIGLSLNLVFLDIQEHHKICECPQGSPNVSESHPYVAPTQTFTPGNAGAASSFSTVPISIPIVPQSGRCGIVPIPAPLVFRLTTNQQAGQNQEPDETQVSDALALSLPTSRVSVMDCSMSNAWFPGHLGGVKFAKLPTINTGDLRRDKIVCAVDFQEPDIRSVLNRPEDSECLALGGRKSQQEKMNAFAYETYDPEKTSVHRGLGDSISGTNMFTSTSSSNDYTNIDDPHKCQRCLQRETLIRLERRKAEHRSKKMLDRGLRSFGSGGGGYNWDMKNDGYDDYEEEEEEDGDEEEEEEMKDVDVDELGIDMEGIIAQARSRSVEKTDDDSSSSSSQYVSYGDDYSEQNLDADLRSRRCYDKSRVGVECRGVADVLLSGEVGIFFLGLTLTMLLTFFSFLDWK